MSQKNIFKETSLFGVKKKPQLGDDKALGSYGIQSIPLIDLRVNGNKSCGQDNSPVKREFSKSARKA